MADGFVAALKTVGNFRPRKGQPPPDTSNVTWTHAAIGIAIVVGVQLVLLCIPFAQTMSEALPVLIDLTLIGVIAIAIPFVVIAVAAAITGKSDRLPGAFLFVALFLTLMQVVSFVFAQFFEVSGSASLGLMSLITFWAGRNFIGLDTAMSVLMAVMVGLLGFGAGFLLFLLPTGQALMAAV